MKGHRRVLRLVFRAPKTKLKTIQETGYFSDLQVYMTEEGKAYKPDERDAFQS